MAAIQLEHTAHYVKHESFQVRLLRSAPGSAPLSRASRRLRRQTMRITRQDAPASGLHRAGESVGSRPPGAHDRVGRARRSRRATRGSVPVDEDLRGGAPRESRPAGGAQVPGAPRGGLEARGGVEELRAQSRDRVDVGAALLPTWRGLWALCAQQEGRRPGDCVRQHAPHHDTRGYLHPHPARLRTPLSGALQLVG
eukprot:scaffold1642_cov252-Pinguiococcus_pyrenoidosus.AAC.22